MTQIFEERRMFARKPCDCLTTTVLYCLISIGVAQAQMTAADLLERYAATQKSMNLQASRIINTYKYKDGAKAEKWGRIESDYYRSPDGRFAEKQTWWSALSSPDAPLVREAAAKKQFLWDGKRWYDYVNRPSLFFFSKRDAYRGEYLARISSCACLDGIFVGDHEPVWAILGRAPQVNVRDKQEVIGGAPCWVMEAHTSEGNYTLWLDPEHGYQIARAEVFKGPDQIRDGGVRVYDTPYIEFHQVLENVRFKQHGDAWVAVEADNTTTKKLPASVRSVTGHLVRSDIDLNPDFDSLKAFVPDFPEGTWAHDDDNRDMGVKLVWRNGQIVPYVDDVAIDAIDKEIEAIRDTIETSVEDSVSGLLARYRATQDRMRSVVLYSESVIEWTDAPAKARRQQKSTSEYCQDGDNVRCRIHLGDVVGTETKQKSYLSFLWDGQTFIEYRRNAGAENGIVEISKDRSRKDYMIATEYRGAPLLGICPGDLEPIDAVIRKTEKSSLRGAKEIIGGSNCYVIDAVSARGTYTVWIDPVHGWNVAKIELTRRKGDLIRKNDSVMKGAAFFLDNVRFERVEDTWIPMQGDVRYTDEDSGVRVHWRHKRIKVSLHPGSGSFLPDDVPDGTKVQLEGTAGPGVWRDGKPAAGGVR